MKEFLGSSNFEQEYIDQRNLDSNILSYFIKNGGIEILEATRSKFNSSEITNSF